MTASRSSLSIENTAGTLRTRPTDHGQVKNPPGDQHGKHDGGLKIFDTFELKLFDLAAGLEDSKEALDLPAAQIPAQGFLCFFTRGDGRDLNLRCSRLLFGIQILPNQFHIETASKKFQFTGLYVVHT